jgi:raffinose/stachyose/melibiose transport system permease protein
MIETPVRSGDARTVKASGAAPRRRKLTGSAPGEPRRVAYLYLAPALLLVVLFVLLPVLHTVYLSFVQWDGVTASTWVGFANYLQILGDPALRGMFLHSAELVFFYAVIPIFFGLLITALFSRRTVRGMTFYRSVLFVPQTISLVVVAIAWQYAYAQNGLANQFLGFFGLDQGVAWLGSFTWALPAIGLVGSWLLTGLCMVLFLSGVQKIDVSLYEAARLDGANSWQEFWHVALPGLRAEISVALTLTVVAALRSFDLVYLLTKGGPGTSSTVPGYEIFARAFGRGEEGSAAALAVLLTIIIVIVAALINRFSKDPEV